MENKTCFLKREKKQSHYDKRLTLEAVQLVEKGMPRKEVTRIYGLGASTLDNWMAKYGSAKYHARKRKAFPRLLKRKVVAEIEQGKLSIPEAQKKYGITSVKTIRTWLYYSRRENPIFYHPIKESMAKRKKGALPSSKGSNSLQEALQEAHLKIAALNTMIDIAEEQLKIDIRKKSGTKQSK